MHIDIGKGGAKKFRYLLKESRSSGSSIAIGYMAAEAEIGVSASLC